jgi:DNA repair exonuclease SbcCD ATPase subunit
VTPEPASNKAAAELSEVIETALHEDVIPRLDTISDRLESTAAKLKDMDENNDSWATEHNEEIKAVWVAMNNMQDEVAATTAELQAVSEAVEANNEAIETNNQAIEATIKAVEATNESVKATNARMKVLEGRFDEMKADNRNFHQAMMDKFDACFSVDNPNVGMGRTVHEMRNTFRLAVARVMASAETVTKAQEAAHSDAATAEHHAVNAQNFATMAQAAFPGRKRGNKNTDDEVD